MSVRIPIQADASQTLQAIESVRAALRATGVDAQTLSNVDLSNLGSKDLVRDLEKAAQNLRDLTRVGRGETATAARRAFGSDPQISALFNIEQVAAQLFPEPAARQRFIRNVTGYALKGTGFDPAKLPPPPDNPPPPPPPPPPEDAGKKILGSIMGGLKTGIGFFLAQAGLSSVAGVAGAAMQAGESENENADRLLRRTGDLATSFEQLIKTSSYLHQGLLVSNIDFLRYTDMFASASGNISAAAGGRGARLTVGEAVSFGSDPGTFARGFGQANFLGVSPDKFAAMIGEAAVNGSMGGRIEEVMSALLHATESASHVTTAKDMAGNVASFADLYTAMNASGSPMLRGQNAVSTIDAINNSIMGGGGGGLAGQVLTMQAMRDAGMTDPNEAQYQLAGGAFARVGANGKTNYELIESRLKREYGPRDRDGVSAAIAAGKLFGINPRVAMALNGIGGAGIDLAGLNETLKPYGGITGISTRPR